MDNVMQITAIGGVPATGKTTLMREVLKRLVPQGLGFHFKEGLVAGMEFPEQAVTILGDYKNPCEVFAGTDKLSMAAQPATLKYIAALAEAGKFQHIIFEGDRLFTASFFRGLIAADYEIALRIIILIAEDETRAARCRARGSAQSDIFLRGRVTKVAGIREKFKDLGYVHELYNEQYKYLNNSVECILAPVLSPLYRLGRLC